MKPEELLVKRVANYLLTHYTNTPFRFDQIDQVGLRGGRKNKMLHGKWSRGYPDLLVLKRTKKWGALYIELKATKTLQDTEHTRRQKEFHKVLQKAGYKVRFACGFDEAKKVLDKYLK